MIHSIEGKSRCAAFILAYLICNEGIKLRDGLQLLLVVLDLSLRIQKKNNKNTHTDVFFIRVPDVQI